MSRAAATAKGSASDRHAENKAEKKDPERYHHGNLRPALIRTGLEILVKEGPESLSLRDVARRVGVSHAAPYRHFADKNELIVAIADEGFTMLEARLKDAIAKAPADNAAEQFRALGMAYVMFAFENRQYIKVMFGPYVFDYVRFPELERKVMFGLRTLETCFTNGQAKGQIKKRNLNVMVMSSFSIVHGVAMLLAEGRSTLNDMNAPQLTVFANEMLENFITGIKA